MELSSIIMSVLGVWLASMEFRLRETNTKTNRSVDMKEVDAQIVLRQEVLKEMQKSIKEDIHMLQDRLDDIDSLLREIYTRDK